MKRYGHILALLLFISLSSQAQVEHTLYGFRTLPQVTMTNPAHIPFSKLNFTVIPGLSSVGIGFNNSGFTYSNLMDDGINETVDRLRERNFIGLRIDNEWLHGGFRLLKKNYIHFSISERFRSEIQYPSDLIRLLWEGNGRSFLGQTADLSNLGFNAMHYREYTLGFAREVNDRVTIGLRAKYLNGLSTVYTRKSQFGLSTDSTSFDLSMTGAFEINTAGLAAVGDTSISYNPLFSDNHGFALDLGLAYRAKSGFGFSVSALNLGNIVWKERVQNIRNDDITLVYRGVPISNIFTANDSSAASSIEEFRDTVENQFNATTDGQSFTTVLPTQLFLGFSQTFLEERLSVSLVGNGIIQDGYFRGGARLGVTATIGKILGVTTNYGVYGNSPVNVGFGFSVTPGPFQFYILSDNILSVPMWDKSKNVHLRFGFNLTFRKQYGKSLLKVRA